MKKITELRAKIGQNVTAMRQILDKSEDEGRALTSEEQRRYDALDGEIDTLKRDIMRLEKQERLDAEDAELRNTIINPLPGFARPGGDRSTRGDDGGFSCLGEFLWAVKAQRVDSRNDERLMALAEKREMQMSTGAAGGFCVPDQYSSLFLQVPAQGGIVRRYATMLEAGSPPDAMLHVPALDQTSGTGGQYGGITLTHGGEGVTLAETNAKIREVGLEPKQLNCYLPVSNKLLGNWQTSSMIITRLLQDAVEGQIDYDCIRGDGVNKAMGFINCAAAIPQGRAGAGTITYADIYNMYSRLLMRGGNPIWIASPTVIPQLAAMTGGGGFNVWFGGSAFPGAAQLLPNTLFGYPIFFSEKAPILGAKGDISLVDLSYYLLKPGSGPRVDISTEFLFTQDKSVFRIIMMMDGKSWLTEPLPLEGSAGSTLSPFVVLAA